MKIDSQSGPFNKAIGTLKTSPAGKLFDRSLDIMGKSLNLRLARHGMSSSNLANIDTPGYRVKDLKFEKVMAKAIGGMDNRLEVSRTNGHHLPVGDLDSSYVAAQKDVKLGIYGQDEKGEDVVDIDQEMTKLSKNHLVYNATVQMLAKEFEVLKYTISEGGR